MIDVHRLKIFLKIADLKSFTLAAKACLLTQPTVSQHIATLEHYFGLTLFDRKGKRLTMTRAGEIVYSQSKKIIALFDELEQSVGMYKGRKTGTLIIGASTIPGECILPKALGRLKEMIPDMKVRLSITDTEQAVQQVLDQHVDIAVVGSKLQHKRLRYSPIVRDELVLIVPRGHAWCRAKTVAIDDLKTVSFVMRESGSGTRMEMGKVLMGAGLDPSQLRTVCEVGTTLAVKESVAAGLGTAFVSKWAVVREVQQRILYVVRVRDIVFERSFYLVRDIARAPGPMCASFEQFLRGYCRDLPPAAL
jgi:DNA-binding transcriptional LysR family regulator